MGIPEEAQFTFSERKEFQRAFDEISRQLPGMFRSFWHRWEEIRDVQPVFSVYAEDGSVVLRITRLRSGRYRAAGITKNKTILYAVAGHSITEALRSAGLL